MVYEYQKTERECRITVKELRERLDAYSGDDMITFKDRDAHMLDGPNLVFDSVEKGGEGVVTIYLSQLPEM